MVIPVNIDFNSSKHAYHRHSNHSFSLLYHAMDSLSTKKVRGYSIARRFCTAAILLHEMRVCSSRHLISRLSPPASPRGEAIFGLHCGAMLSQPHRRWDFAPPRGVILYFLAKILHLHYFSLFYCIILLHYFTLLIFCLRKKVHGILCKLPA